MEIVFSNIKLPIKLFDVSFSLTFFLNIKKHLQAETKC